MHIGNLPQRSADRCQPEGEAARGCCWVETSCAEKAMKGSLGE